jgi:hypothetical protein
MFIRIKKLKGKEYAYLVDNTWTKKGSRQKTKKYLGRCIVLEKKENILFKDYFKLNIEHFIYNTNFKKILSMLFELELIKHGFDKNLVYEDLKGNSKTLLIKSKLGNNVVLKINEGFLCTYNLKKVLNFKFKNEESDAYLFAESFLIAGIDVDQEIFVEIFRKLTNQ